MRQFLAWLLSLFTATTPIVSPVPSPQPSLMTFGEFRYASVRVNDFSNLQLFSNLNQREAAVDLSQKKGCEFLTNAGFYDTNNRHLGWFYTQGQEVSQATENRLFDGFLALKDGQANIGFDQFEDVTWGVQTGPVLVYEGRPLKLSIRDDQPRRRVVAAINSDNELSFMIILSPESDYAGPLLGELPQLVKSINPEAVKAINLDGGSASAFLNKEISLKEYSPIGGYFCYTEKI
jgi:uncharacterized protein YigE (DUF2233 family)